MAARVVCQGCGAEFEAKRSDQIWCSACARKRTQERARQYDLHHKGVCPDCGKPMVRGAQYCLPCSNRRRGEKRRGENNGYWKGGVIQVNGYIYHRVRHEPGGAGGPYKAEHHLVWEQTQGQPLPDGWVVHHLNGVHDDNRPENLVGMPRQLHHQRPREALYPYEERIRVLEEELRRLRDG